VNSMQAVKQAQDIDWEVVSKLSGFPSSIRETQHDNEMRIKLRNGSIWQCVGSDNYDNLVGSNPVGVVFSEFALSDPKSWEILRPILAENGGWAMFISTPRGMNFFYDLFQMAKADDKWFAELLTVEDTKAIDRQAIEDERAAGMPDELIQQEFFCSFQSAVAGAYYGRYITEAEKAGRISRVPWEPTLPVFTSWDLGIGDSTAIWFAQECGKELRIIGYYENSGVGLEHYTKELASMPFTYAAHFFPPDVAVRELGSGLSRVSMLKKLGITPTVLSPSSVEDGIGAVRNLLGQCWFDEERCGRGLKALRSYKCEYSEKLQTFTAKPLHDWTSHAADAFRYLAIGLGQDRRREQARQSAAHLPATYESDYSIFQW